MSWTFARSKLLGVLFVAALCVTGSISGLARPWKPSPVALAQDYTQIRDNRGKGEVVLVWWIAPQWFTSAAAGQVRDVLDKYVLIAVAHAKPKIGGALELEDVTAPQVSDADSKSLKIVTGDDIPPVLSGFLTTFGQSMRQSLGPFGQGIHWFVFEAGSVHACVKGRLSVAFADETYTYDTPIPGCP